MGTTTEEQTPAGYIQRAGMTANVLLERTSDTAYGRRSGSLYPFLLLLAAAVLVLVGFPLASLVPLLLLALWVGGNR